MFTYSLFGLPFEVNRPLPGFVVGATLVTETAAGSGAAVRVMLDEWPDWLELLSDSARPGSPWFANNYLKAWKLAEGRYYWLIFNDRAEFVVDAAGQQIWARRGEAVSLAEVSAYLLGSVAGLVLRHRGFLGLHAGAVAVNGRVIGLMGRAGAGKSTTVAALAGLGYPVLSDNILALYEEAEAFLVQPAYPCIRLLPASVQAVYGHDLDLPKLLPDSEKGYLSLSQAGQPFQAQPLPLTALYFLAEREPLLTEPKIEPLTGLIALQTVLANLYPPGLLEKAEQSRQFEQLGRLLKRVPVRRLRRPADLGALPHLCEVLADEV